MDKDLIIGGAANYSWKELQYWVNSIRKTDFKGDVVLCCTDITNETIDKLTSMNVKVYAYGKQTAKGFENHSKAAPHVERFFHMWHYLRSMKDTYRFVVATDTRDVIFQKDPIKFLEDNSCHTLVASSEGMLYKDEPWGNNNLLEAFGPFFHDIYKDQMIYNVGTMAGYSEDVRDLMFMLFQLSINRPIPIVDQAVYNIILNQEPWKTTTLFSDNKSGWAIQLGTSKDAVAAGKGDLGAAGDLAKYIEVYQDVQPVIKESKVTTPDGEEYFIVHQWDRVPHLKTQIEKEYGDGECSEILTIIT